MRHKERIDVKNIREKEIVKVVSIGQKDVRFRLQNAYVGQVGDNTELLDETLVDNMLELMAKAVKTNYSKYNPVPNEIIIRNTMSEKKEDKPEATFVIKENNLDSVKEAYNKFVTELKNAGYNVSSEDFDFEDLYQMIIKIEKADSND